MKRVSVIDFGLGNLLSVCRAFEKFDAEVELVDHPRQILDADRLVLPGVGAFGEGMDGLIRKELVEPILEYANKDRPFLGICLGMQLMLDFSSEFERREGLGLIPGAVVAIPKLNSDGQVAKIPHIGWSSLRLPQLSPDWTQTVLCDNEPGDDMYFVHSYQAIPQFEANRLADIDYNGERISAAIFKGNLVGCQFHPEKSGPVGLRIIRAFLK
ncbi:MAG: imidazole glycerol phosphate synthase subunit HisH [Candidatus Nitrohelix vancouverensis]|uniref:Imidazole glycerol phosphate synthase subunit HisH n=1 Tax=Candidatus Nitrohelix vancouverensis TaxID=2705534 RepID=A0A7T0G2B3_9BACT|nr:MAG: imidazole glycerol phosphate synthase subunit HisH [Candidatus Nitrohelix vancouverensis]